MEARKIYDRLRAAGMSHAGACAMLGNMEAESSLKANNLQNSYEKKLGFVDELYTLAVDKGSYTNFAGDGAGYGLCQWTYAARKRKLLDYAGKRGASIGDGEMQVDFAVQELKTEYMGLWSFLCCTEDMYTATERICKEFERPAVDNTDRRYAYALKWDRKFGEEDGQEWLPPDISILILQGLLVGNGYNTPITGHRSAAFLATLGEFVQDIGGGAHV